MRLNWFFTDVEYVQEVLTFCLLNAPKLIYSTNKIKKFHGGNTPLAGGGDPLPHLPPARPTAVRGRYATDRPWEGNVGRGPTFHGGHATPLALWSNDKS